MFSKSNAERPYKAKMNRLPAAKSLYEESSGRPSVETLYHNLDDCSPEEMGRLMRNAPLLNNKSIHSRDLARMQSDLLSKKMQPIYLHPHHERTTLTGALLYAHFEKAMPMSLTLYNIDRKEKAYTRLYEWGFFSEMIQPFIRPIHFAITQPMKKMPVRDVSNERAKIQDALIESHFTPNKHKTLELIWPLERGLNALLQKIILFRNTAFFLFDWTGNTEFILVVAFRITYPLARDQDDHTRLVRTTLTTLETTAQEFLRHDLEDQSTEVAFHDDRAIFDVAWLRRGLQEATLGFICSSYAKKD